MPPPSLAKIFAALCLAAVLTVPALSAAERQAPAHRVSEIWNVLARSWAKIGCIIDPDGRHCASASASADIGCGIDPSGRCASGQ